MKLHDLDIDTAFSYNGQVFTVTGHQKRGDGSIKVVETLAPDNKPAWFVANHDVRVVDLPAITKAPALTKEQLQSRAEMLDSI